MSKANSSELGNDLRQTDLGSVSEREMMGSAENPPACPACTSDSSPKFIESYGKHTLFACPGCDLHFWVPRVMPDSDWYALMYGGRDAKVLPLEPGHKYFLADPLALRGGTLLDIGCGTGNFLATARNANYDVTGIELDSQAAAFAKETLALPRVFPYSLSEFAEKNPGQRFQIVTFFEVLEHQAAPLEFIRNVREALLPNGYIALSVPNRERWLTGPDVFDYPPNHFLRWSPRALSNFLTANGFEILSIREQPADVAHTAIMLNMLSRTGLTVGSASQPTSSFRDVMQMPSEQAAAVIQTKPSPRQRIMQLLARVKAALCYPVALVFYPYVRAKGYKGTYLYCLARCRT